MEVTIIKNPGLGFSIAGGLGSPGNPFRDDDVVSVQVRNKINILHWWLVRVSLVVAFGFLPQNSGRWWRSMNGTLSFYECRFSAWDTIR